MKKFIHKILLFVLPAWAVLTVVDYIYSEAAIRSNRYCIESWYDLMNGKIESDVIVMGSSRAWVHINPIILDSVLNTNSYNIGFDGSCINRQVRKYHLFRRFNKKPKLIIQNIDYASLGYTIGYMREQFFPYFWNKPMRDEFLNSEPFSFEEKYIPFFRYLKNFNMQQLYEIIDNTSRTLTKGYEGKERKWDGSAYNEIKSIEFVPNDTTMMMFENYLKETLADSIKIIFVYAPLYYGAIKKITNIDEMYATYAVFANKYNIPILDYTNMTICSDKTYFYNALHLNIRGAKIFTDSLAYDLKKLEILSER